MLIDLLFCRRGLFILPIIIHRFDVLREVVIWILAHIIYAILLYFIPDGVILTVGARLRYSKEGNK